MHGVFPGPQCGLDKKGRSMKYERVSFKFSACALFVVYACAAAAQESVLYSFSLGNGDADSPVGRPVVDLKGNLYGTTEGGGDNNVGAVYELSRGPDGVWSEKVLHSFSLQPSDGNAPQSGLILDSKGALYGTTYSGGKNDKGTVFELTPQASGDWTEKVLYNFGKLH